MLKQRSNPAQPNSANIKEQAKPKLSVNPSSLFIINKDPNEESNNKALNNTKKESIHFKKSKL